MAPLPPAIRLRIRSSFIVVLLSLVACVIRAQEAESFHEVTVTGKAEDLLGQTAAASNGQASSEDLLARPILRRGEVLESIPGLIVTQHAGDGKANQYFLRGFNLDHGTDFATDIEGMPMNMRTHAHGQGYTDLNLLIPEMVENLDYVKGTYSAANGDLSTAGSASFHYFDTLPGNFVSVEAGEHNYLRGLLAGTLDMTPAAENGTLHRGLTYGLEYNYYDGPWKLPEHSAREAMFLRYFDGNEDNHLSVTFMGYHGQWTSSDQVPQRAISEGLIPRFGYIIPTDGGSSQRYSLNILWRRIDGDVTTTANLYGLYYDLNLFSDFTYFLADPLHGDQFNQREKREVFGGNVARTWEHQTLLGKEAQYTLGFQTRSDFIPSISLYPTKDRQRLGRFSEDRVFESSAALYGEGTVHWNDWFRTVTGLRGDLYYFDVHSNLATNTGSEWAGIVSPKFSAVFGPWQKTELYLNYGMGFHSNDARGVNTTVSATTGAALDPATPLVRTQGAEFGVRTQAVPHLTSTLALYWLKLDSELVYDADVGENTPGPPSERYGIEWSNYWRPAGWFGLDAELALTHSRFTDTSAGQNLIPQSVPLMFAGGITLGAQGGADGFFASLRARAFGKRPLENNAYSDRPSFLVNGSIGYRHKNWEAALECLNILNRADNDIAYYYASRLPGEAAGGVNDVHLHPTEPRQFRLKMTYWF